MTSAVQMVVVLALAQLLPALILTATCFTRFVVVFSFLRAGMGTQGAPPNQVLIGLALFMTGFVMAPVASEIHEKALTPYLAKQMDERQALAAATPTIRAFLLRHTRQEDLELFYEVSSAPPPASEADVPLRIAVPAFTLSELRTSFQMGLTVLLPFLVIDLVVATILSSLGMVMVPPVVVSLPIKLLLFLVVDGWHLVVASLLRGTI